MSVTEKLREEAQAHRENREPGVDWCLVRNATIRREVPTRGKAITSGGRTPLKQALRIGPCASLIQGSGIAREGSLEPFRRGEMHRTGKGLC